MPTKKVVKPNNVASLKWLTPKQVKKEGLYLLDDNTADTYSDLKIVNLRQSIEGLYHIVSGNSKCYAEQVSDWYEDIRLLGPLPEPPPYRNRTVKD